MVYLSTLFNTYLDSGIVVFVMRRISLNLAMHGTLDESHYDRVLAGELYALIVPGYLITPYLIGPVFEDLLPRFVYKYLVRSTTHVAGRHAENVFTSPCYDLTWHYSDILINLSVC